MPDRPGSLRYRQGEIYRVPGHVTVLRDRDGEADRPGCLGAIDEPVAPRQFGRHIGVGAEQQLGIVDGDHAPLPGFGESIEGRLVGLVGAQCHDVDLGAGLGDGGGGPVEGRRAHGVPAVGEDHHHPASSGVDGECPHRFEDRVVQGGFSFGLEGVDGQGGLRGLIAEGVNDGRLATERHHRHVGRLGEPIEKGSSGAAGVDHRGAVHASRGVHHQRHLEGLGVEGPDTRRDASAVLEERERLSHERGLCQGTAHSDGDD